MTAADGPRSRAVRRVLLLAHTGREDAREVARAFVQGAARATASGSALLADEAADLGARPPTTAGDRRTTRPRPPRDCELAIVIGGDGTILRAAELTHDHGTPLLGVNLGHVGFLAEAEHDDVESTDRGDRRAALHRRGAAHHRRLGPPRRRAGHQHLGAQRGQRREGRPRADARGRRRDRRSAAVAVGLRRRGVRDADRVHGLQLLRRRPGRLAGGRGAADGARSARTRCSPARWWWRPSSVLAVEVLARTEGAGVLWCDGRRTVDLPPGARIEVRRGASAGAARAAARGAVHRPARRQVRPAGRRAGAAPPTRRREGRAAMLEEIRIGSLGVIESSTLELGPGLTVITGETGAGKTMLVTALGPAARRPRRHRRGAHRRQGRPGRGRRARRRRCRGSPRRSRRPAARSRTTASLLARNVSAEGRSRAFAGGAVGAGLRARRAGRAAGRGARPVRPAPAARAAGPARRARPVRGRRRWPRRWRATPRCTTGCSPSRPSWPRSPGLGPRAGPRGRPAAVRARRDRGRRAAAGRGRRAGRRGGPARVRRHAAGRRRAGPRGAVQRAGRRPTRWPRPRPRARRSTASATTTPRPASWPTGWPS